jgi:cytidylate kinase
MAVITISKQYGSLAEEVSNRLCTKLGYRYFEKKNILQMADEAGLSDEGLFDITVDDLGKNNLFHKITTSSVQIPVVGYMAEGSSEFGSSLSTAFTSGQPFELSSKLNKEFALTMIQSIMHYAVKKGNIIIAGRGGQALLQDKENVYHFRIIASLEKRIENVMKTEGLDENKARKVIKKHDSTAEDYLRNTYKINWDDPDLYHLVINLDKMNYDQAAEIIIALIQGSKTK